MAPVLSRITDDLLRSELSIHTTDSRLKSGRQDTHGQSVDDPGMTSLEAHLRHAGHVATSAAATSSIATAAAASASATTAAAAAASAATSAATRSTTAAPVTSTTTTAAAITSTARRTTGARRTSIAPVAAFTFAFGAFRSAFLGRQRLPGLEIDPATVVSVHHPHGNRVANIHHVLDTADVPLPEVRYVNQAFLTAHHLDERAE